MIRFFWALLLIGLVLAALDIIAAVVMLAIGSGGDTKTPGMMLAAGIGYFWGLFIILGITNKFYPSAAPFYKSTPSQ